MNNERRDKLLLGVGCLLGVLLAAAIDSSLMLYRTTRFWGGLGRVWESYKLVSQPTQAPPAAPKSPILRFGEPGRPAIHSLVYWIKNGTYVAKPAMSCEPGNMLKPTQFLGGSGNPWNWSYRDLGDRWVFEVDGPPDAIVFVWAGCESDKPAERFNTPPKPIDRRA